jgi:hypothetical protein
MSFRFPSDAWIVVLSRLLNGSPAKDWDEGFIFLVEPSESFSESGYLLLGPRRGKSPRATLLAGAYAEPG